MQVTPEPALEKRTRRQFRAEYKLRIITEADACKHGEFLSMTSGSSIQAMTLTVPSWRR
jgi:hypothetical protein